ncbi:MAG: HD-GYP domain-containing protein [Spirochaetota bacterium]|nr:HD-GYP domain-containing protein [Spirochaetota bacterium]
MEEKHLEKLENIFSDFDDHVEVIVKHLKPGIVLASSTYDKNGNLVHPAYTPFTQNDIESLISSGIDKIFYTKFKKKLNTHSGQTLNEYLDNQIYKGPRTITIESQKNAVSVMEKIVNKIKNDNEFDVHDARLLVENIMNDLNNSDEQVINLLDIQAFDDYTYTHSLNVGVIGMVFARKLKLHDDMVKKIGLGGFLHDVGKVKIPFEIINKDGKLTSDEYDIIKQHVTIGYKLIKNKTQVDDSVKQMILFHHEKLDGSGYPLGLKNNQIEDYIAIITIADYYDALTTERSYKKAFTPRETLHLIMKKSGIYFKSDIAHKFANEMFILFKESNFYTVGSYVLLNTNEIARVISKDYEFTSRPCIEILRTQAGKTLSKPLFVDLNLDGSRNIIKVVDIFNLTSELENN